MRKLMWFTVGFTAACGAGVFLFDGLWLLTAACICLLSAVGMCLVRTKWGKRVTLTVFGCAAAFALVFCFDLFYLGDARNLDGKEEELVFTASDYSYPTDYGVAADGWVQIREKRYQIKVYIPSGEPMIPGDRLTGTFRLRYTASGASQEPTYHQGKGIFLLGYCRQIHSREAGVESSWLDFPAHLRNEILQMLDQIFPPDTAPFAKALLLGDKTDLSYTTKRDFQTSGISHVVAVSGMHVSVLFALLFLLCGKKRILTAFIGIPMLLLFAALAGFTPSVVRACIMQLLMILALLLNREYDPPTALSFSVLVILVINPMSIASAGFQLSCACMIGIFGFSEQITKGLLGKYGEQKQKRVKKRLMNWLAGSAAITLSTMITTVPLCALHFGMVSVVGVITNLLTVWVIGVIFYGVMLACLTGFVWLPLGSLVASVISWPARYVLWLSAFLSDFPAAAVYTQSVYVVIWLVLAYVLLLIVRIFGKKYAGKAAICIVAGLALAIGLSWLEPRLDRCRVTVMDVGQGQCILLKNDDEYYMVDCGSEQNNAAADTALNLLFSRGIFRLDGLILTHYDADHASDVINLMENISVERLYLPDIEDTNGLRKAIVSACPGEPDFIRQNTRLPLKNGNISLITSNLTSNDNESSMCVLFQSENYDILITGDRSVRGERELIDLYELPKLELLVAGHHGAADATGVELLSVTKPDVVAISAGANNRYYHPAPAMLERLKRSGCKVVRTDRQGTIEFRG